MSSYRIQPVGSDKMLSKQFDALVNDLYGASMPQVQPAPEDLSEKYLLLKNTNHGTHCVGRFAFYENPHLSYNEAPAASIGAYECINDSEAAKLLLDFAQELSRSKGYSFLIGPMEGSTWNRYRFALHADARPFLLEPRQMDYYPEQFAQAHFGVIGHYFSSLVEDLRVDIDRLQNLEEFYRKKGIQFRSLDPQNLEEELTKLGKLSLIGFAENFLYTPISLEGFVRKYQAIETIMDADLVHIAENQAGEIEAFIFCLKDLLDPTGKTMIIKTLVRSKNYSTTGIGTYLNLKANQIALNKGFDKVIHALMFADNVSLRISKKSKGIWLQEYHLYAAEL